MEPFEVTVDDELFRISESIQPGCALSYDFAWLNGPADGTYNFTISRVAATSSHGTSDPASRITRDDLVREIREFVERFYEPGEIGGDFPGHVADRSRHPEGW